MVRGRRAALVGVAGLGAVGVGVGLWRRLGPGMRVEEEERPARAAFRPGQVIHTVFLHSSGNPGALTESRQETWSLIGGDGNVWRSRVQVTDHLGRLEQEGFSDAERDATVNVQLLPLGPWLPSVPGRAREGPVIRLSPRPDPVRPVMWTAQAIREQLEARGLRAAGSVTVAGVPGTRYEAREPVQVSADVRYPLAPAELRTTVRRVYVGRDPFGADLGEAHGYEDRQGRFHAAQYRRLVVYEVVDDAPGGTFEWPYGFLARP